MFRCVFAGVYVHGVYVQRMYVMGADLQGVYV